MCLPSGSNLSDDDQKQSISAVGVKFQVTSKSQPNADVKTKITIIGNETGGSTTIDVTVNKTVIPINFPDDPNATEAKNPKHIDIYKFG